jgi:hypothetical protein
MQEAYGSYTHLLSAVLKQLGFFVRGEEDDLVVQMVEQLRSLRSDDKRLLLVLDDAHDISPGVWKRFQSWLDYQDRGTRMIQVLLVGPPSLKKTLSESSFRGWRRWVHGKHELRLLSGRSAAEEIRRILRQTCDDINQKSRSSEPIGTPNISWFAVKKIARESGGRPGMLNNLVRRALAASIREGGSPITHRFLSRSNAMRSPSADAYKQSRLKKRRVEQPPNAIPQPQETEQIPLPAHPLGWMRYALGTLLVLFVIGAGWGITAWLSIPSNQAGDTLAVTASDELSEIELETESTQVADSGDPAGNPDLTSSAESPDDPGVSDLSPWGPQEPLEDGWQSFSETSDEPVDVALAPLEASASSTAMGGIDDIGLQPAPLNDSETAAEVGAPSVWESPSAEEPSAPVKTADSGASKPASENAAPVTETPAADRSTSPKRQLKKDTLEALMRLEKKLKG